MSRPVVSVVAEPSTPREAPPPDVPRLLWGWPEIEAATGIPRRSLEREMHRGFPKPVRRVGRRPYWRPSEVVEWAGGGGRP